MAKKKPTARQRNIERLAKDYQASVAGLEPEYQSIFEEKTKAISGYEQQSKDFQKRLEDYQKSLAEYKAKPFEEQKIKGSFRYEHLSKAGSADPYTWGYAIDGGWYPANALPGGYVEESQYGEFALKKKPVPKFEEAPPQVADTSEYDAQLEQLQAKRKTLGEGFEREKAERKSSQLRAVSQRSRERPMLSKGVTL
jgi:hypothetical protein